MRSGGRLACRRRLLALAALILVQAGAACRSSSPIPTPVADIVFEHADVYTMDASRSWAEAVAIGNGLILAVGTREDVAPFIGPGTAVVDLRGRMLLPGFHDSHVHPLSGGIELGLCDLNGLTSREAVVEAIRTYARAHPKTPWIVGGGFDLPLFPGGVPLAETLDGIVPDRPAYLTSADGHTAWVNSRALAMAGIDRRTPDPLAGRIERLKNGSPAGTLRESAMDLVKRLLPEVSDEERRAGLRRGLELANRFGITSLVEADADEDYVRTYEEAASAGELTVRALLSQHVDPKQGTGQIDAMVDRSRRIASPRLRADSAKLFADGVIEGGTAALLEPYVGRPGDRGTANYEPAELTRLVTALYRARLQVHVHAIGDRAIRETLDAIEHARAETGWADARPHLAHIQLFDPRDIPRFRHLGVIANFQPLWAYRDTYIVDLTEPRLGPERMRWNYPIQSLLASGAVVVGGSDWSVSSMNPLDGIQVGVTRVGLERPGDPPWIPEQRASLPDLLAAYTINGAYLHRMERDTGSIEPGKLADLVVLDRNLFDVPPSEIHTVKVNLTLLEGTPVWSDGAIPLPGASR